MLAALTAERVKNRSGVRLSNVTVVTVSEGRFTWLSLRAHLLQIICRKRKDSRLHRPITSVCCTNWCNLRYNYQLSLIDPRDCIVLHTELDDHL